MISPPQSKAEVSIPAVSPTQASVLHILYRLHSLGFQKKVLTSCPGQAFTGARPGQRGGLSRASDRQHSEAQGSPPLCRTPPRLCEDWSPPTSSVLSGPALSVGGFVSVTRSHFSHRFCAWKAIHSYFQYMGKKFKDTIISPKHVCKYPPWSGGKLHHDPQPHSLADETHKRRAKPGRTSCKTSQRAFAGRWPSY